VEDDGTTTELDRQTHTPAKTGRRVDKMKIRDGDIVPELKPTSTVTFNGGSRGQIVLSNHQVASFRQHKPDTIIVTIGDKTIARATVANGRVSKLSVSRGYQDRGIAEMLNRSVAESFARNPRAFSPK
jgi:RNase P/RNase MRP subunit p30